MLCMLRKNSADDILKHFSYFSEGDNLHENVKDFFLRKIGKFHQLSFADFADRVVNAIPCHAE